MVDIDWLGRNSVLGKICTDLYKGIMAVYIAECHQWTLMNTNSKTKVYLAERWFDS